MSRLAGGGLIDRSKPLRFTFDGRAYTGFAGDTLASALVANGVRLVGRSFKYHRPRGILTAGPEEPNALVTLRQGARAEPNTRATTIALFDGLAARSQNCWPGPGFDLMAVNQLFAPLLVAGFYYKTFMWPAGLWERLYEPLIRRAAGLGRLSMLPDPDTYDREHGFCDLLVIGGGPAGLAAALAAGRAGLRVILAEDDVRLGGRLLSEAHTIDGMQGLDWVMRAVAELDALPNVTVLCRTGVFGIYDGGEYGAIERVSDHLPVPLPGQPRQRLWKIVARHAVLATGAIERPIVFGGNDRPGVMMASAVSAYVNRFAAVPGRRAVVFTSTDSGWATVDDLRRAGVEVAAVVDARPDVRAPVRREGVPVHLGAVVIDAHGKSVKAVDIRKSDGRIERVACDLVAVSGGWNPAIGLGSNLGARPVWSEAIHGFVLDDAPPGLVPVGAAAGNFTLAGALQSGEAAALACGGLPLAPSRFVAGDEPVAVAALWHVPSRTKCFVDFQHDVTADDVALATREGFASVEHLKRYTTLGMATDQGKTSQVNGQALLAAATGRTMAQTGTILNRPPYQPVAIGALAGHHRDADFRPVRKTVSHDWAARQGASFVDAGQWKRAQWFTRPDDRDWQATVNREVAATRAGVGICDVSTLGKIDVQGPDAGALLDRLYINGFSTLAVGRTRYGVMLREDGMVFDDGTATRFAEDRYFVTTTTVNAARVMQHIDYARQVLWPDLDVQATSVTEHWATYAVAGPRSRALLQAVFADVDLSNQAFGFMAAAETAWREGPARICRVSFSGELAFEVSVPAAQGMDLLQALFNAGRAHGVTPYGVEALGVMRIEKGHPAGNELNGTTTAADLGMGALMSRKKDFIGRVMADRPGLCDPDRPRLVGLRPCERGDRLRGGAHLLSRGAALVGANDEGHVTSAAWSPTLDCSIALALLRGGPERHGETIMVHDPVRSTRFEAHVCGPVFVDPEGARVRG
jgi:methylglutamate dehydrogenase subunit C